MTTTMMMANSSPPAPTSSRAATIDKPRPPRPPSMAGPLAPVPERDTGSTLEGGYDWSPARRALPQPLRLTARGQATPEHAFRLTSGYSAGNQATPERSRKLTSGYNAVDQATPEHMGRLTSCYSVRGQATQELSSRLTSGYSVGDQATREHSSRLTSGYSRPQQQPATPEFTRTAHIYPRMPINNGSSNRISRASLSSFTGGNSCNKSSNSNSNSSSSSNNNMEAVPFLRQEVPVYERMPGESVTRFDEPEQELVIGPDRFEPESYLSPESTTSSANRTSLDSDRS